MRLVGLAVLALCAGFGCSSSRDFHEKVGDAGSGPGGAGGKAGNAGNAGNAGKSNGGASTVGGAGGVKSAAGGTGDEMAGGSSGDDAGGSPEVGSGGSGTGGTGGSQNGGSDNGGSGGSTGGSGAGKGGTGGAGAGGSSGSSNAGTTSSAGSGGAVDHTPPTVAAVTPANNATGVVSTSTIKITFSEAMDESSVEGALSIAGLLAADLTFSWNSAGTVLTITPKNGLVYDNGSDPGTAKAHKYTVTITVAAADLAGNPLASTYNSNFSTLRRVTQQLTPALETGFFDPPSPGYVAMACYDGQPGALGHANGHSGVGDGYWLLSFQTSLPSNVYGIESSELQGTQADPQGDFYSTGTLQLDELVFQTIDETIPNAAVAYHFGTYASSYTSSQATTNYDITSKFAAEFGGGQRNFLYRLSASGSPENDFASPICGSSFLNITYTLP
jgi:hypothetical protein